MKILVCGGRDYRDEASADRALNAAHAKQPISMVIEGGARGADELARRWARNNGVHSATVPALWTAKGKAAGHLRNEAMLALVPDAAIVFPGGRGTADMLRRLSKNGTPYWQPYGE